MTASASRRDVCKIVVLEASSVERDSRACISAVMAEREASILDFCARKPGSEEDVWERECWRWEWRAWAKLRSSMSFSGLGGIGGATKGADEGVGNVSGSSIRSGGGGGLALGCIGGCCVGGCHGTG